MTTPDLFALIADQQIGPIAAAISGGADVDSPDDGALGWRPLHAAVEELEHGGSVDVLILLLRHGADVDGWDRDRSATPLLMAFFRGQGAAVRVLLAAGASADAVGSEGDTPLLCAVEQGDPGLLHLVLSAGPGPTLERPRGLDGVTPLGLAASRLDVDAVQALRAAGAQPATPDADHRVPRDRLPTRTADNAARWDEVAVLLPVRPTRA